MQRIVGWGLISLGVIFQQLAVVAFTATSRPPKWFEIVAGIGFFGWWIFIVAGVIVLRRKRP